MGRMTAMETNDLVVVTGPLKLSGVEVQFSHVLLKPGEVAQVIESDEDGNVLVYGFESDIRQWIELESLTPLDTIQADEQVGWGDLLDPDYVHDFVWEEVDQ